MIVIVFALFLVMGLMTPVSAWNDFGHMTVGSIAYDQLGPHVRAKVDGLLKLNPSYQEWVAGVAEQEKGKVAFMKAATWPDMIKNGMHYTNDGNPSPRALMLDATLGMPTTSCTVTGISSIFRIHRTGRLFPLRTFPTLKLSSWPFVKLYGTRIRLTNYEAMILYGSSTLWVMYINRCTPLPASLKTSPMVIKEVTM